jgi:hypothetical protein
MGMLKYASCSFRRKPTQLRETGDMQYRLLCAFTMLFATHAPPCSNGNNTPLKRAIDTEKHDVVAFLRSVGAPE